MAKRSDFVRVERGFYPTPFEAVVPLSPYLTERTFFAEPCAGNGDLIRHIERLGHECVWSTDIEPGPDARRLYGTEKLAVDQIARDSMDCAIISHFITNPPWPEPRKAGSPTLGIIRHLASIKPTWLLLSADFKHNVYAPEVMAYCRKVVSVGRVRWIPDSTDDGKDNAAWYLFDANHPGDTVFHARGDRRPIYAPGIEELL